MKIIDKLIKKKITISIAESCTGGLLSSKLTSKKGISKIFKLGIVSYSNQSKINILKVQKKIIANHGAVSPACCQQMLIGINKIAKSDISIAITGIAGPGGSTKKKPVGLVYIGIKYKKFSKIFKFIIKNKGRAYIQKKSVNNALYQINKII